MPEMEFTVEAFLEAATEYCEQEIDALKEDDSLDRDFKRDLVDSLKVALEVFQDEDYVDIEHILEALEEQGISDSAESAADRLVHWEFLGFRWGLYTLANCDEGDDLNVASQEFLESFAANFKNSDGSRIWRKNWPIMIGNFLAYREDADMNEDEALSLLSDALDEEQGEGEWENTCWVAFNFLTGYSAAINSESDEEEAEEEESPRTPTGKGKNGKKDAAGKLSGKIPEALEVVENPGITFDDVVGMDEAKKELEYNIRLLEDPKLQKEHDVQAIGGILLHGPPGTGKTYFAKAAAGQFKKKFFAVDGASLISKYIGDSEKNIRDIFDFARKNTPCILFFDELDAIAIDRGKLGETSQHMAGQVNQLLQQLDGIKKGTGKHPIVIGATNFLDRIDPAARRPGRFDALVYVPPMSAEARLVLLKKETSKRKLAPDVNLPAIATRMDGWTPAEIKGTVDAVKRNILKSSDGGSARPIAMADLQPEIERMAKRRQTSKA